MSTRSAAVGTDLPTLLDKLRRERFYGRISFDLRDGEVILIRTERTQLVSTTKPHQGVNRDGDHTECNWK